MKAWAAICFAALVAVTLTCWSVRASKRPARVPGAMRVEIVSEPAKVAPESQFETAPTAEEEGDAAVRKMRSEKALALLEEDRETRIKLLIASIDWSRADSRIRFPIEHDLIQADYERAVRALAGK